MKEASNDLRFEEARELVIGENARVQLGARGESLLAEIEKRRARQIRERLQMLSLLRH